jgi:hypothetical protein
MDFSGPFHMIVSRIGWTGTSLSRSVLDLDDHPWPIQDRLSTTEEKPTSETKQEAIPDHSTHI